MWSTGEIGTRIPLNVDTLDITAEGIEMVFMFSKVPLYVELKVSLRPFIVATAPRIAY